MNTIKKKEDVLLVYIERMTWQAICYVMYGLLYLVISLRLGYK